MYLSSWDEGVMWPKPPKTKRGEDCFHSRLTIKNPWILWLSLGFHKWKQQAKEKWQGIFICSKYTFYFLIQIIAFIKLYFFFCYIWQHLEMKVQLNKPGLSLPLRQVFTVAMLKKISLQFSNIARNLLNLPYWLCSVIKCQRHGCIADFNLMCCLQEHGNVFFKPNSLDLHKK